MKPPRLSVVTAVYNGEKYLAETIRSVLNQTFTDFEYIIIDDCSTDSSLNIIDSFKDSRIKLLRNSQNERLVSTRNKALAVAQGEYVALTDQDDVSVVTRFAEQIAELDTNKKLGLVGSWFDLINGNSEPHGAVVRRKYSSEELKLSLMFRNPYCNSTVMVRREAMAAPPYDPEFPLCEDYNFIVNISNQWDIGLIQSVLLKYRTHGSNYSTVKAQEIGTLGNRIKLRQIKRLLPDTIEASMTIHNSLENITKVNSHAHLVEIHGWLTSILHSVPKSASNYKALRKVIAREWFEVASKAAWLGSKTWQLFQTSTISKTRFILLTDRLKLRAKCLLRRS
jgi:glycosyltransferase involved in cell wall biosynthesis